MYSLARQSHSSFLFPTHPESGKHNHRQDTQRDNQPEGHRRTDRGVSVHAEGQLHVHSKQTCEERRERNRNRHNRQVLHQRVHVVADDACAGIHHGRQNVGVDFCLLQALAVFNDDIVQQFPFVFAPVQAAANLQLLEQSIVAVQGAHIVNQALVQAEHAKQVLVFHGRAQFLFQLVVNAVDNLQVFVEVEDGVAQHTQHEGVQAVNLRKALFIHDRNVRVRQEQNPVLEDEYTERFHAELEVVACRIVLRLLKHDRRKIVIVFDAGKFVRVESRGYGICSVISYSLTSTLRCSWLKEPIITMSALSSFGALARRPDSIL